VKTIDSMEKQIESPDDWRHNYEDKVKVKGAIDCKEQGEQYFQNIFWNNVIPIRMTHIIIA